MQNLEIMKLEEQNKKEKKKNDQLISDILNEDDKEDEIEFDNTQSATQLTQKMPDSSNDRSLYWKKWKKKKIPSRGTKRNWKALAQRARSRASAKVREKVKRIPKKRIPRKKRTFTPIPSYKPGRWKPRTKLKYPRFSLKPYGIQACPCKGQKRTVVKNGKSIKVKSCTCGVTHPSNATFEDNGPFPQDFFGSKDGEDWYTAQANVYRQYLQAKKKEQIKNLKQARSQFTEKYQEEQIRALTKHYQDMHNISAQLVTKKDRIFKKMRKINKKLVKKTGKETTGSIINACKLGISKAMIKYSTKYPKFLRRIQKEIGKWKAFMLEKHHIYYEEHEEKVQEYYDALEREKNDNLALEDAKKDAENQQNANNEKPKL
jgi:hypothetical protein